MQDKETDSRGSQHVYQRRKHPAANDQCIAMSQTLRCVFVTMMMVMMMMMMCPTGAEETGAHTGEVGRQKRDVPNWALTSSDFFGWVEDLRKHAGYDQIQDLARTFWAHFPSADRLGYGAAELDQ
ncbi:hypothetical protein LDENG_00183790 [Lucifuga dentata]|nr:hypothetical protein LDENG_00183790 [Lucifuga dentata]